MREHVQTSRRKGALRAWSPTATGQAMLRATLLGMS